MAEEKWYIEEIARLRAETERLLNDIQELTCGDHSLVTTNRLRFALYRYGNHASSCPGRPMRVRIQG